MVDTAAAARRAPGRLLVVLGDQLSRDNPVLRDYDPRRDLVWMCEAPAEAVPEGGQVPSHKARIVLFLSAMRHFRDRLLADGLSLRYLGLDQHPHATIEAALRSDLADRAPQQVRITQPGEHRLLVAISRVCGEAGVELVCLEDDHFLCSTTEFARWAEGRRELRLEHFYRWIRRRDGLLMESGRPAGGAWNFDRANRKSFGRKGPGMIPEPIGFAPDAATRDVMRLVDKRFPGAPGRLRHFDWPLTADEAEMALADFIRQRLPAFGPFQDAMWTGEPFLYHARISAALNLKLLAPGRVMAAAVDAYREGHAPIASVEGFVRQVIGWREYVRGIYWREMPGYLEHNILAANQPLPAFYWSGETDYACLAAAIGQVVEYGYGHHIQRLMVTGLFALLLGVQPRRVHEWYLGMFVDAVEWVEAPNTLGMSQFADGGLLASKPYAASGAYIQRMSNYCTDCPYDPRRAEGELACPFTTLYWDFLARHRQRFGRHPRTALMWRNLERLEPRRLAAIRAQADALRSRLS